MSPEQIVDLVDFRYLTDVLTPEEALEILIPAEPGRAEREQELHFVSPVDVREGAYRAPLAPGSGAEMLPASVEAFRFPSDG